MALPIAYNLRNLVVRKATTAMTALGIGLTVAVLLATMALLNGLRSAFQSTGSPRHVLVTRKGATSELVSGMSRPAFQDMKFKAGIEKTAAGEPMASLELVTIVNLASVDNPDGANISVRGLLPVGREMRPEVKLARGRWFAQGRRELTVGKSIAKRFPEAHLGGRFRLGQADFEVVGVFDAGRSAANSEIWADLNQIAADYNRTEGLSSVLLRATDEVAAAALINDLTSDRRLNVDARTEREYYDSQTSSGAPIRYLGIIVSVILAIGSSFAAMNTMYASVARRTREIGTLRVLGFSQGSILLSFFLESLLLALAGGVVGCLLVLPLNGFTTGVGSNVSFSEVAFAFEVSGSIMLTGVAFALVIGAFGGLFPARMAARKEILTALREI
jgi:putative ABC transport system permease protein